MNLVKKIEEQKEFLGNLIDKRNLSISDTIASNELMHGFLVMRSKIMIWKENGEKTFILSKDLIEAFKHTDIPTDIKPTDFNYPFDVFMIEGQTDLFETKIIDKKRPVYSILYVNKDVIMKQENKIILEASGKRREDLEWDAALTAFFTTESIGVENIMIHMKNNKSIREAIDTKKTGQFILEIDEEDATNTVNLFFNSVLYINDPSRNKVETEEIRSRSFKDKKGGKFRESKYILLKPPKNYKSINIGSGKKLDKRFIVRGHWRNQAYGENKAFRKLMWIKPHWKGPNLSEVVSRPYKVEIK